MSNEERIQFFNSQSSFGSESSLASSRYFDLTNQIAEQTQTVLMTLRKQFLPTKQLTNFDKIDYLHNRANIIFNDTIPEHLLYLNKIQSPAQSKNICNRCSQNMRKFIKDYESLKNGTMLHKQFYNIYGRSSQNNVFFKKQKLSYGESGNHMLEPDVVQVNIPRSTRNNKLKQVNNTARGLATSTINTNTKNKQLKQLHQQITRMKKRQSELKNQFDQILTNQRINCEKRVRIFLNSLDQKQNIPEAFLQKINNYKHELTLTQSQLDATLNSKKDLSNINQKLESKIRSLQSINYSLKQQLAGYKKLQNSRIEQQQQLSRSFHSQYNNGDSSKDTKKLNSLIKKLTEQRDILRNQLAKQRQSIHSQKNNTSQNQAKQLVRLKHYLNQRNKQNQQITREFDKVRVELIQLKQQNKNLNKNIYTIKQNNQELKIRATHYHFDNVSISTNIDNRSDRNINFRKINLEGYNGLETSIMNAGKPASFEQYNGQGIEGYPYFELLSKQFKIRFKRSCLKQKQLLYKSNGLQIGVISDYFAPNVVKMLVHITNSSQTDIKNFKVKAMNPNENKVQFQIQQINILTPNQQVKVPVSCTIRNYPIGPVVLVLDYMNQFKHDIRLLLPVHIFKCVQISHRTQNFYKPTRLTVNTQRKICKDNEMLKQFLNCSGQQQIKVKIRHQHSNSILFLDAKLIKQQIQIQYEHISGMERFTEYFIKTLMALFQKLH